MPAREKRLVIDNNTNKIVHTTKRVIGIDETRLAYNYFEGLFRTLGIISFTYEL